MLTVAKVIAGLAYEYVGRPWDVARRTLSVEALDQKRHLSIVNILMRKLREEGLISFFRDPYATVGQADGPSGRLYMLFRTMGRVGPWGVGFLVWEAYGPANGS